MQKLIENVCLLIISALVISWIVIKQETSDAWLWFEKYSR